MDLRIYVIANSDPNLAREARRQGAARADSGVKMFLEFGPGSSVDQICREIGNHILIGSSYRLQTLHICAHGNPDYGYVAVGTGLRAAQTRAFRSIRRCWINTSQVAYGACIEMNVCDAAGYGMTPVMMGLANDAGVPVRACPEPILVAKLFAPTAGFRTFYPSGDKAISDADYVDVETALS